MSELGLHKGPVREPSGVSDGISTGFWVWGFRDLGCYERIAAIAGPTDSEHLRERERERERERGGL